MLSSHVAAGDRFAGDVAEGETGADGRAGADRLGADRMGHRDAGAVEPADHAPVRPQHLAARIGARPALGAEAGIEEAGGEERRLLDRAERPLDRAGVVALPRRLAAMEVAIDALLRPAVESLDRRPQLRRIEADLLRQRLEAGGTAHERRILRGVVHAERMLVAAVEDAPDRQMPGPAV